MSNRIKGRAFGLVELVISTSLLLLLVGLIFALYANSYRVWKKSADHQEVMSGLQTIVSFLTKELQAAPFESVTIDSDQEAISFLTLKDNDGRSNYTDDGRPLWHHWLLFYRSGESLYRRTIDWTAPEVNREVPVELTVQSGQPLSSFRNGEGRRLTDQLEEFQVSNPSGSKVVNYRLLLRRKGEVQNIITLEGAVRPRN